MAEMVKIIIIAIIPLNKSWHDYNESLIERWDYKYEHEQQYYTGKWKWHTKKHVVENKLLDIKCRHRRSSKCSIRISVTFSLFGVHIY